MAKVLAVLNRKGGVGKTTLALSLGRSAALEGQRVLLVDADPQGSLRDWHAAGNGCGMEMIAADTPTTLGAISTLKALYDLIVIDGGAAININAAAAVRAADGILIPIKPSSLDLWSTNAIVEIVKSRREIFDGKPDAWFVLNQVASRSRMGREAATVLPEFGLPVLDTHIKNRVLYSSAATNGSTVLDVGPASAASHEIRVLHRELKRVWA